MASAETGVKIYTSSLLRIYDLIVLLISNTYIWRCSTKDVLLPFFREHLGRQHLDVGVGTGYFPANSHPPSDSEFTLVDLNRNSLETARARIDRPSTRCYLHDATKPLPIDDRFDSISLFYLLHCTPGPMGQKTKLFTNLKHHLVGDGILYGSTILGQNVKHNVVGRFIMWSYNRIGIFDNHLDSEEAFVDALKNNFQEVEHQIEGTVLLFTASRPKIP